jgi:hypothetical protein
MSTLDAAARKRLSNDDFAYIDADGGRHLPINDEAHVRAALARFNQTQFESDAAKSAAKGKILAAARKFGIDVSGDDAAKQADEPDSGDVHADQPLTNGGPKRSPMLKKLIQGLRTRVQSKRYLTAEDIETEYRSALGHAGGKGRKAAEPTDWEICSACSGLSPDQMPADDCDCPACQEGDPADCLCKALAMDDADDDDPSAYREGSPHIHSESGEDFRLFLPGAFAEAPAQINYLPKPGTYTHPTYGKIEITPERNRAFVQNFQAGVYQDRLPIDAEHQTKLSGAVGWITGMRQNADGSVDASVDWTQRGRALMSSDGFRYFSPEWYDAWQQPETGRKISDVAIGGALTTRPFFKSSSLRPLVANESGFVTPDDSTPFTAPQRAQESQQMADDQNPTPVQLTEDEIKRFREMESEYTTLKAAHEATQAEAKAAAERVAALEAENSRRALTEQAAPWHGETAKHVAFMESLTAEQRQQYAETISGLTTALTEAQKASKIFSAVGYAGAGSSSAMSRLDAAATALKASEPTLSDAKARAMALKSDPSLYAEYQKEMAEAR